MIFSDLARTRDRKLLGTAAVPAVGAMIAALFACTTLLTPLYVIYEQQFGFSRLTLTLIYAVYVIGNLAALLLFGRMSDRLGRRRTALIGVAIGIVCAVVFLLAQDVVALCVGRVLSGLAVGIGAGTYSLLSDEGLGTHNAYLQVLTEVGLPALILYLLFIGSAFRGVGTLVAAGRKDAERSELVVAGMAIQGALVAYLVGSFFADVAYLWYLYYPAAFAVCLRQFGAQEDGANEAPPVPGETR